MNFEHLKLCLLESSSTSSSSSESDEDYVQSLITAAEILIHHPKSEEYVEHTLELYSAKDFEEHFKIAKHTLQSVAEKYEKSIYYPKKETGFVRLSGFKIITIFVWFSTHEAASFRDVADRFDISIATLHFIIENVSRFLSVMSQDIIKWPVNEEKQEIVQKFNELGFPGTLGCIDGTHVRIDKPEQDSESYLNRKNFYSIQVQIVCDADRNIRDVFLGYPGSVHDARVFRNSPLYNSLLERCGEFFLVGDSAYPCLRNLITPYRDNGRLSEMQKNFNTKLGKVRVKIEHTFGILKQKFRQLYHLKIRNIETICHFIRACCVLYNLSLNDLNLNDLYIDTPVAEAVQEPDEAPDVDANFDRARDGQLYRDYLARVLYE